MKKFACLAIVLCLVGVAVISSTLAQDGEKPPTIKQIMANVSKKELPKINKALKVKKPNWKNIQKSTGIVVKYTKSLADNNPPKGDPDSWKEKAGAYHDASKALDDAAKDENLEEARAASKKMMTSCKSCHDAHKGK